MIKVSVVEQSGNASFVKGRLMLIHCNNNDAGAIRAIDEDGKQYLKPVIVAEAEEIEVGDWGHKGDIVRRFTDKNMEFTSIEEMKSYSKVIALSENFSSGQREKIRDGILKHGDKIWIECEDNRDLSEENIGVFKDLLYRIRLNKSGHVIFRVHEVFTLGGKRLYTGGEVKNLMLEFGIEIIEEARKGTIGAFDQDKWIDERLK